MTSNNGDSTAPIVRSSLPLGGLRILAKHAKGERVCPATLAHAIEEIEAHLAWHDARGDQP